MSVAEERRGVSGVSVAAELEAALAPFTGGELPVRLTAWDGSVAGPEGAPGVALRSPDALRRMIWQPGELGAAQAYVTGELEFEGDLVEGLTELRDRLESHGVTGVRRSPAAVARALRTIRSLGGLRLPPAPPRTQARVPRGLRGRLHQQSRDRWAISHHYDLGNDFYRLILDDSMAYSSAYWTSNAPDYTLADAQRDKFELVLGKLGLEPGMTMLDVGCGWGSLSLYAASKGIQVTGLTIAAEQKRFIDERIAERGISGARILLCDYRDAPPPAGSGASGYDAVASLEMGEHVGQDNYPTYAEVLHRSVRPGGRVLVQQMSRRGRHPGGGPFIESFIAPDMHMRPVGETVDLIEGSGLEVRDVHTLREHYVRTVDAWTETFTKNRDALVALADEEMVRVWELYLAGGGLAFRDGRMGVDQILAVRPDHGRSGMDPVRRS